MRGGESDKINRLCVFHERGSISMRDSVSVKTKGFFFLGVCAFQQQVLSVLATCAMRFNNRFSMLCLPVYQSVQQVLCREVDVHDGVSVKTAGFVQRSRCA